MTYLPPTPPLHVVRFTIEFSDDPTDKTVLTRAHGVSSYKRGSLWTEAESFTEGNDDLRHAPADWIHHVALAAVQDRPNTTERLIFSLTGGLGFAEPLF